jgi:hypothetical protein
VNRIEEGLHEERPQFKISKYFKVIEKAPSIKDEDLNKTIQKVGAHIGGAPIVNLEQSAWGGNLSSNKAEVNWFRGHKK